MKRLILFAALAAIAAVCVPARAQAANAACPAPTVVNGQATKTYAFGSTWSVCWQPTCATGTTCTFNVYRAAATPAAVCSTQSFTKVASAVTALAYTDAAVGIGAFCYYVTNVSGGVESPPSSDYFLAIITPPVVSGLNATP